MAIQKKTKLNQFLNLVPEGLLVDSAWMETHGFSRALRKQWVTAGHLASPAHGVFWRPRGKLTWEHVVVSMQTLLKIPVSVGGASALEQRGYIHYLKQEEKHIHLYSDIKLPSWLPKLGLQTCFVSHNRRRMLPQVTQPDVSTDIQWGALLTHRYDTIQIIELSKAGLPLVVSSNERACLEYLDQLPSQTSFHMVDVAFESMTMLRPQHMQLLLESCSSIKVKRLFLYYAHRHNHAWLKKIDESGIELGKGNRKIAFNGKLDPNYKITIPKDM